MSPVMLRIVPSLRASRFQASCINAAVRVAAGLLVAALAAFSTAAEAADKRVALIIGNSAYRNVNNLPNPARDAGAMGAMLRKAGFDVVDEKEDLTNDTMRRMIRDFSDKARDADVAVVFYAGHGIEIDGTNYLLPIDAKLERDVDVDDEAISLDRIVRILDPVKKLRLVILDACRDNPFAKTMKRSLSSRGVERGLAKVEPQQPNTLIAYAAKAGSTASDGEGSNSPFTTALLKQLPMPGQDLRKSLGYVRDEVLKATTNKQEPFVYGSLGGDDVVLVPGAPNPSAPVPAQVTALDPNSQLRRDYELAAQINTRPGWDAFLATYQKGFYADLARAARRKLDETPAKVAAATAEPRNLSAAQPDGHAVPGAAIAPYIGKSYRVTFGEQQTMLTPFPDKVSRFGREAAVYVKAADDIANRFVSIPRNPNVVNRFGRGKPGDVDRGLQVNFGDKELLYIVQASNYRIKIAITAVGNACKASVAYELQPGQQSFRFRPNAQGEPVTMKTITGENVACWVSPGDAVGEPPLANVTPPATPPQPATK